MDRVARFRELFGLGEGPLDPAGIPKLMRFGGFSERDALLVERAVRLHPEPFRACLGERDRKAAQEAALELQDPAVVPIVSDMRASLGLGPLREVPSANDRRSLFRSMVGDLGRASLEDGSMSRRGFGREDVLMVGYIARACRQDLYRIAWDPDPDVARRAAAHIADVTSLDMSEVLSLMDDIRGAPLPERSVPRDPGLVLRRARASEAKVVRYTGSEGRVEVPPTAMVDGAESRITQVSDNAFAKNAALTELVLPEGVVSIGKYAFYGCSSLASVVLPGSLRSIGAGAFCRCSSLESVDLPRGLESIGDQAFLGCPMDEVFLPESVASVGRHSFPPDATVVTRSGLR